jgi:hypothetical protein
MVFILRIIESLGIDGHLIHSLTQTETNNTSLDTSLSNFNLLVVCVR